MEKICGVYKITNTITGDFYVGSSKDVKRRWASHKWPSRWNKQPNNPMYIDMKKYGLENFVFEILAEVEAEELKEIEQKFIERLNPTYNSNRANGLDIERQKHYQNEYQREYEKESERYTQSHSKANKKYKNQLCCYNGETLTLNALSMRFKKLGVEHPTIEAKKYLIKN